MEYGNGASLFLTRVTAWLRLTYLLGIDVALQLVRLHPRRRRCPRERPQAHVLLTAARSFLCGSAAC